MSTVIGRPPRRMAARRIAPRSGHARGASMTAVARARPPPRRRRRRASVSVDSVPLSSAATAGESHRRSTRGRVRGAARIENDDRVAGSARPRNRAAVRRRHSHAAAPGRARRRPAGRAAAKIAPSGRPPRYARSAAALGNPDSRHRHAAARLARDVRRMLMQQHLHFAQPAAPASRVGAGRQVRIDRATHGGQRRRRKVRRRRRIVTNHASGRGAWNARPSSREVRVERRRSAPRLPPRRGRRCVRRARRRLRPATSETGSARST